ncbi:MAG: VOC family protein [Chromatiales bacterium]|nr:VOC family protein [Chromatiales bacterium]
MTIKQASVTLITPEVEACRQFYERHFGARPTFDCGWYQVLRLEGGEAEICLMAPQEGMVPFAGGITINLQLEDVDGLHAAITAKGIEPVIALEDHPWGDRGFGVLDPAGAMVYCYRPIEPAAEFRQYFIG